MTKEACPNKNNHTKVPNLGFLKMSERANKKGLKYKQMQCKDCGLYVIWKKKRESNQ